MNHTFVGDFVHTAQRLGQIGKDRRSAQLPFSHGFRV
jgi:hypothetical protein